MGGVCPVRANKQLDNNQKQFRINNRKKNENNSEINSRKKTFDIL